MSTTVIHQGRRSQRSTVRGTVAMVLAGLVVSAGIGYAIANQGGAEATAAHPRAVQFDRTGQKRVAELHAGRMTATEIESARSQALVDYLTEQYWASQEGPGPR